MEHTSSMMLRTNPFSPATGQTHLRFWLLYDLHKIFDSFFEGNDTVLFLAGLCTYLDTLNLILIGGGFCKEEIEPEGVR